MAVRTLVGTAAVTGVGDQSPWVEPDYISVMSAADLAGSPEERRLLGPAMLIPAGLLPDSRPPSGEVLEDAELITGYPPHDAAAWCSRSCSRCHAATSRSRAVRSCLRRRSGLRVGVSVRGDGSGLR
jgi:hypothetical protein